MGKKHYIRVRNGFSDRNNINIIPKNIQLASFSDDTRIALFNSYKNIIDWCLESFRIEKYDFIKYVTLAIFNETEYECNNDYDEFFEEILEIFKTDTYDSILTFVEASFKYIYMSKDEFVSRFPWTNINQYVNCYEAFNETFEEEYVGYRFINENIVEITNKEEIESINSAINTPFELVNLSMKKAIINLSETGNKDYENSIKESVTSLEQLMNILLKSECLTVSNAAGQFFDKKIFDDNFTKMLKSIYKYSSDTNGIRHGNNKEKRVITFHEAKFVLVLCSALINLLVNIKLEDEI